MTTNDMYVEFVLKQAPRLLSQIDCDKDSPTYGCCDRNFWHYKIRDFPSAILQQSGLGLGLLYANDFKGNIYYKKAFIKDVALATLKYWVTLQHRDGSFDEYWPNEHGFPPTAFTLFSACELVKLFSVTDTKILRAIKKSAKYLAKIEEKNALNQEIAAIAALKNASIVLDDNSLSKTCQNRLSSILKKQSSEGWFEEYGGVDLGYLSVSLNFLSEYYRISQDKSVEKPIRKMIDFLQYFVHPDGSFGGDYGSRNTAYFLPAGFEIAATINSKSKAIVAKLLEPLSQSYYLDDRYLGHYVFHSFVRALFEQKNMPYDPLPFQSDCDIYFKQGGLVVKSTEKYYFICNTKKGGVFVLFDKSSNELLYNDAGYRVTNGKKIYVSNWVNDAKVSFTENKLELISHFYKVGFHKPSPLQHTALRLSSLIMGRKLIPLMKSLFIFPNKQSKIKLKRTFSFKENKLIDIVVSQNIMKTLSSTPTLSLRYCPSSRYFQSNLLTNKQAHVLAHNVKKKKFEREFLWQ